MSKQSRDRIWHTVHSWIGLKLSLFMTFILATGTLAVFSAEIDWLFNPEMRASESVELDDIAWGKAYDSFTSEYPDYELNFLSQMRDNWFALEASANTPWGESVYGWLEPNTGDLRGVTGWYNVQRFLRNIHRHLMMPARIGIPIVTALAFPLLVSLVAGFVIYKKFWRGLFRWPRFDRKTRIWSGDIHRLMGLWGSWFVALIALTSVWYFIEEVGGRAPPFPRPGFDLVERQSTLPASFSGADLETMLANARQELPGLQVRMVSLPFNRNAPLTVQGDLTATLVRPRANAVYLDPVTLEAVGSFRGEDLNLHTRISEASDPLHFGYFGGFPVKLLWFVFGAMMTAMSLTGVVIYATRLKRNSQTEIKDFNKPLSNVKEARAQ